MTKDLPRIPVWRRVWFAAALCGLVLLIALVPPAVAVVQKLDMQFAYWLNGLLDGSPVFARLVLLVADDDGRERVIILLTVAFLVALWLVPDRAQKARKLGMLLFVALVMLCFFLVDALLDDIFERKSPSYFLKPFFNIEEMLNFRVDLKDRRSFPSALGMILFTSGFLLTRLGSRRGGPLALLLGLTVPLLMCVAGLNWVSDIYLGALPISLLLSALAVETPFGRLRGTCVDVASAGMDQAEKFGRSLGPMWKHRRLYWASQNVFHMEVAMKRFLSRELKSVLDPDKHHQNEEVGVTVPLGGLRSVVRVITLGPLKAVVRAYPLNRRIEVERHYRASTLLNKHGVRVPKVYHYVDSPRKYGALFLVEEFVDGRSLAPREMSDDDIESAARELARLHGVTSEVWGAVDMPRTEDYGNVQMRRVDKQLSQVARGAILKGQQANVTQVRQWFEQWRNDLNAIRKFSLIHGKLHRENCLFERSGGFCLLDITTLEWGLPTSDLVLVHHSQCGSDEELIRKFDAAYYGALPAGAVAQGRHFEPLYDAMFCLAQVAKYSKRLRRSQKRQVGDAVTKGSYWWHKLLEIVEKQTA